MHTWITAWVALLVATSGCITLGGGDNGTEDPSDPQGPGEDDGAEEPSPDVATGGDPEEDVVFNDRLEVPEAANWSQPEHHFRIMFKVSGSTDREVRLTFDVGEALNAVGLEWVGTGVPLVDFGPDPGSVVIQQLSGAGIVTATLEVEARQAGSHALEVAFHHIGGLYVIYFDDLTAQAPGGGDDASFPAAEDATGRRAKAQWQGDDLWGLLGTFKSSTNDPGDEVTFQVTVLNQGRADRKPVPVELNATLRVPDGWGDATVEPSGPVNVTSTRSYTATLHTPGDASGSATAYLDVSDGATTLTAALRVTFTSPSE